MTYSSVSIKEIKLRGGVYGLVSEVEKGILLTRPTEGCKRHTGVILPITVEKVVEYSKVCEEQPAGYFFEGLTHAEVLFIETGETYD